MEFEVTIGSYRKGVSYDMNIKYLNNESSNIKTVLMISANLAQLSSVEMRLNLSERRVEEVNRHNAGIILLLLESSC